MVVGSAGHVMCGNATQASKQTGRTNVIALVECVLELAGIAIASVRYGMSGLAGLDATD